MIYIYYLICLGTFYLLFLTIDNYMMDKRRNKIKRSILTYRSKFNLIKKGVTK